MLFALSLIFKFSFRYNLVSNHVGKNTFNDIRFHRTAYHASCARRRWWMVPKNSDRWLHVSIFQVQVSLIFMFLFITTIFRKFRSQRVKRKKSEILLPMWLALFLVLAYILICTLTIKMFDHNEGNKPGLLYNSVNLSPRVFRNWLFWCILFYVHQSNYNWSWWCHAL